MTVPTEPSPITPLVKTMGGALLWGWAVGSVLSCVGAWAVSPGAGAAAVLAAGAVLVGTVGGLATLLLGATWTAADRSFLILGSSIFRATAAALSGLLVASASGAPDRTFWVLFLVIIGCVMTAEVAGAYRLLLTEPSGPAKEQPRP